MGCGGDCTLQLMGERCRGGLCTVGCGGDCTLQLMGERMSWWTLYCGVWW